jgi:hypothetical protein
VNTSPLLEMHLRTLHLSAGLSNYHRLLGEHTEPLPNLTDLISLETAKRQENGVRRCRIANLVSRDIFHLEEFAARYGCV